MLRTLFVLILVVAAAGNALRGPFEALLFYLWIAYFRPDAWMWSPTLVRILSLSFNVGLYLIVRSIPSLPKARVDLRALLLVLFGIITGLSAFLCRTDPTSWRLWIDFAKTLTITYILYALTSKDLAKFRQALVVMAISLGLESAKQGYIGLLLRPGGINDNTLPQLGDNNGVAVGMLMLGAIFIALAKTATKPWEKRLHQFFVLGVIYRAITTYSRGAFLSAGTMMIFYVARSKQKFKAAFGAAVLAGIILSVLPQSFWDRMSTMNVSSEDQMEDSSRSRIHFWRVAVLMADAHPVLGVGYNAFNANFDAYDFSNGYFGRGRSVHSMWFGILAELGYPGLAVFISMFLLALLGMGQVARKAKRGQLPIEYYHYAVAIQTAFAACIVGGSFVPWQYTEMLYHFFALSMALRQLALAHVTAAPVEAPITVKAPHVRTGFQPAAMRGERAHG